MVGLPSLAGSARSPSSVYCPSKDTPFSGHLDVFSAEKLRSSVTLEVGLCQAPCCTTDILDWIVLRCGDCPIRWKIFNCIPGLYLLDANNSPLVVIIKVSRHWQIWWAKLPLNENHWLIEVFCFIDCNLTILHRLDLNAWAQVIPLSLPVAWTAGVHHNAPLNIFWKEISMTLTSFFLKMHIYF